MLTFRTGARIYSVMTTTAAALLAAVRRFDPSWTLTPDNVDYRGRNFVAGRLNKPFAVKDTRGRVVGGEAVIYTEYRMVPNPELVQNGGTKDYGMTMVATDEVAGFEVRVYSTRDGRHFGAIPRRNGGTFATLAGAQHYAEQKLDLKRRQTEKAAAKTGGTYMTDGERRRLPAPAPTEGWRSIPGFNNRHED